MRAVHVRGVRKVTPAACSDALCERDGEMSGASCAMCVAPPPGPPGLRTWRARSHRDTPRTPYKHSATTRRVRTAWSGVHGHQRVDRYASESIFVCPPNIQSRRGGCGGPRGARFHLQRTEDHHQRRHPAARARTYLFTRSLAACQRKSNVRRTSLGARPSMTQPTGSRCAASFKPRRAARAGPPRLRQRRSVRWARNQRSASF